MLISKIRLVESCQWKYLRNFLKRCLKFQQNVILHNTLDNKSKVWNCNLPFYIFIFALPEECTRHQLYIINKLQRNASCIHPLNKTINITIQFCISSKEKAKYKTSIWLGEQFQERDVMQPIYVWCRAICGLLVVFAKQYYVKCGKIVKSDFKV